MYSAQDNGTQIMCEVKNCVYHQQDNMCSAPQIEVGPHYATNSTDTICATFKPQ